MRFKRIPLILCIIIQGVFGFTRQAYASPAAGIPAQALQATLALEANLIRIPASGVDLQTAIRQVVDGGIIEISSGTYNPPAGGWLINDPQKRFTIRAAQGATVVLDGKNSSELIRYQNSAVAKAGTIFFRGITFINGKTSIEGLAGAVTIYKGVATFENCTFIANSAVVNTTVGGALYVADQSTVFIFNSIFQNNTSKFGGAALGVRSNSKVYVHASQFLSNRSNLPNHSIGSSGGAINAGNSILRISNSRFDGNQAGGFGGAVYAIGNWVVPESTPHMDVIISNSTFINNQAKPDPTVSLSNPTEGGAINNEDQSLMRIYNSRFYLNRADIGGGVNSYRGITEIYDSIFQGNYAMDTRTGSGFGGSISLNSADTAADGTSNRPSAHLLLKDSLVQGNYAGVTNGGRTGGCLHASGDVARLEGSGVSRLGTVADNQAQVTLQHVVMIDCHALYTGGGIETVLTNLTIQDTLIANSDVTQTPGSGGAIALMYNSTASIQRAVFSNDSSTTYGGAIFAQGSSLNLNSSTFSNNKVPGTDQSWTTSYGAALFVSVDDARKINASGLVNNNVFINNSGMAIFDDDRSGGPINAVVYNANLLFSTFYFQHEIYRNSLANKYNAAGLNTLVVTRAAGIPSTVKSTSHDNVDLQAVPATGMILAVPGTIPPIKAAGDAGLEYSAFLGMAWNGAPAAINGNLLNGNTELLQTQNAGNYGLVVNGTAFSASVSTAPAPAAKLSIVPNGNSFEISWKLTAGNLLEEAIDQGLELIPTATGSGSITCPKDITYHYYGITAEGGVELSVTTGLYKTFLPAAHH